LSFPHAVFTRPRSIPDVVAFVRSGHSLGGRLRRHRVPSGRVSGDTWQARFEPPHVAAEKEAADLIPATANVGIREEVPTGPTLQVVAEIGFPDAEDEGIAASYRRLAEPLPLQGDDLPPTEPQSSSERRWKCLKEGLRTGPPWSPSDWDGYFIADFLLKPS
jgi:hypothetical protein